MDFKPVYVICCKDKFLAGNSCKKLLDRLIPADQRAMALYQPPDDKAELADVLDELRTLPFLAERRVVLIKGADGFVKTYREGLEKYFDSPSGKGVLVLVVDSWPKNTRLAKKLAKIGELISDEVKPWEMGRFAVNYAASEHDKKFAPSAGQLLVELAGDNPGRICGEIDKLALYCGEGKTITVKMVEDLVGHNRLFNVFAVIDAMTARNSTAAIERLRNMFAGDSSAEFTAVGAFAYHFRRLFQARAMLDKGVSRAEVAKKVRVFGNKSNDFFRQVGQMPLTKTASVMKELARIDHAMKTGGTSGKVAIERLVIKLCSG